MKDGDKLVQRVRLKNLIEYMERERRREYLDRIITSTVPNEMPHGQIYYIGYLSIGLCTRLSVKNEPYTGPYTRNENVSDCSDFYFCLN